MAGSERTPEIPAMPPAFVGALGRPVWNESLAPFELLQLARTKVPLPPGEGRRIVLVTGYLAGPIGLRPILDWLRTAGYHVDVAGVGMNMVGSDTAVDLITETLAEQSEGGSILIGHSRGGQQARVATQRNPDLVAQLITLGSPVRAHLPRAAFLRASVEVMRLLAATPFGPDIDREANDRYEDDLYAPFDVDVPWTSIWSKIDGVVEWQACMDPQAESIEIRATHVGMLASVASFRAIATALGA